MDFTLDKKISFYSKQKTLSHMSPGLHSMKCKITKYDNTKY